MFTRRARFQLPRFLLVAALACALPCFAAGAAGSTPDQKRLEALAKSRPSVADADNAFLYFLALRAPAGADLAEVGRRERAWFETWNRGGEKQAGREPLQDPVHFKELRLPALRAITLGCGPQKLAACHTVLSRVDPAIPWSPTDELLLERYRTLLTRKSWSEPLVTRADFPLPSYADLIDGQRLYFLRLLMDAGKLDASGIRKALEVDARFWRMAQRDAGYLISKMISIAALRQHYFFGNELLRRLPAASQAAAVPGEWRRATDSAELSQWRVAAGEYAFSTGSVDADESVAALGNRDATLKDIARVYVAFATAFEVPVDKFPAAAKALGREFHDGYPDPNSYALRAGAIESMRRAVTLLADLRAAGVPRGDVAGRVSSSALRDPLTGAPFDWSDSDGAIVFRGPTDPASRAIPFAY